MPPFLVCIHDASPAFARETRVILRDLAPLVGRRLSLAVVPDWHGEWPLEAHRDYCAMVENASEQLLLHGYLHRRQRGWGPTTLLAERCDEMNGLDADETLAVLARGQHVFAEAFGKPARGFLAPGWQVGHARGALGKSVGLDHVMGFFSLRSAAGASISLATWTWDCGPWSSLGRVGHGIGALLKSLGRGVPALAIHPRDLERGYWPTILKLTSALIDEGHEPDTPAALLEATGVEAAV
jgi:peptidoglycan/xylan/chitin deacetylase (PgdA/CDA1 family)